MIGLSLIGFPDRGPAYAFMASGGVGFSIAAVSAIGAALLYKREP